MQTVALKRRFMGEQVKAVIGALDTANFSLAFHEYFNRAVVVIVQALIKVVTAIVAPAHIATAAEEVARGRIAVVNVCSGLVEVRLDNVTGNAGQRLATATGRELMPSIEVGQAFSSPGRLSHAGHAQVCKHLLIAERPPGLIVTGDDNLLYPAVVGFQVHHVTGKRLAVAAGQWLQLQFDLVTRRITQHAQQHAAIAILNAFQQRVLPGKTLIVERQTVAERRILCHRQVEGGLLGALFGEDLHQAGAVHHPQPIVPLGVDMKVVDPLLFEPHWAGGAVGDLQAFSGA